MDNVGERLDVFDLSTSGFTNIVPPSFKDVTSIGGVWPGNDGKIYFSENTSTNFGKRIHRAPDEPNIMSEQISTPALTGVRSLLVDPSGGKMYAGTEDRDLIHSMNIDGSDVQTWTYSMPQTFGMSIHHSSNTLFVAELANDAIFSMDLNSEDPKRDVRPVVTNVDATDVFVYNDKLYFMRNATLGYHTRGIYKCDLDGTNIELVFAITSGSPSRMHIDGTYIYWTDISLDHVRRVDIDGSNPITLVTDADATTGIAVDEANSKLYYLVVGATNKLVEYDLATSGTTTLLSSPNLDSPQYMKFHDGDLYIAEYFDGIKKYDIVTSGLTLHVGGEGDWYPHQITVHKNNVLYFADLEDGQIRTVDLNDVASTTQTNVLPYTTPEGVMTGLWLHDPQQVTLAISGSGTRNPVLISDDSDLFIHGHEAASSGSDLFVYGHDTASGTIPMAISGAITPLATPASGQTDLFVGGDIAASGGMDLFTKGIGIVDSDDDGNIETLFIHGHETVSGALGLGLFMIGGEGAIFDKVFTILHKTPDFVPQAIGAFANPASSATIEVWSVIDGNHVSLSLSDDTCYAIGNTGRFGWSTNNLPAEYRTEGQFVFRMTSDAVEEFVGDFTVLSSTGEANDRHPEPPYDHWIKL
jgi:hypothetical protein